MSDFRFIQELNMEGCNLDVQKGKEIADGLMRAKQLEILKIGNNPYLGQGG